MDKKSIREFLVLSSMNIRIIPHVEGGEKFELKPWVIHMV
jgi:hypothetical protein